MALPTFDTGAFATNPQQWVQPYGQGLAGLAAQQLGRPIDVGAMTPGVAGPGAFTQAQQQLTADMGGLGDISRDATGQISGFTGGTGIASFQPYLQSIKDKSLLDPTGYQAYMSPYQQQVIDTTLAEFDKQAQIGKFGLGKSASQAGAFGGARHGIAQSEYQSSSDANRAMIQAGLLQQGFGQGLAGQQQALGNISGMASLVPTLQAGMGQQFGQQGTMENQYAQALQNQMAQSNQMAMNYPMQRIGQAANIFGATAGQVPGAPVTPFAGSPAYAGIGAFANLQSMMGARTGAQT
jgi:hypothetical protein